ncbi:hybrid sensor histidine kinase/response regulator [Penaeicola halotolerans]|uniref:hybrid sensor histidine kinase/response regulator n=1 Tax=Penaeicola halotolerans TaxID=2793196 RepID=UPI001CF8D766|nr:ATP-binding protein [Penaeicola halotolerans]
MKSYKILITEDDNVSVMVLKKALLKMGHVITGIEDTGQGALNSLSDQVPDLVLMDIGLPGGMDGIKTTEIINANYGIPVVFLTGSSDDETIQKVAALNPSGYVIKPFNERELSMVIETAIFKDRKEKELTKLNNELDQKVKERTADLERTNEELQKEVLERIKAQKELEKSLEKERELGELKTRIVANVSHGFKTPLTSILSSAQLIMRYTEKGLESKEKIEKHANKIETAVRSLNNLLTGVLFFGKADALKVNFNPNRLHLGSFVQDIMDIVKTGASSTCHVNLKTKNIDQYVYADSDLLYQILENLLSNACKYSPDKGEVNFELIYENGMLSATISDQGIGIPQKDQNKLFDRFYRASNVGVIEGSGLGLSIVKKCVELHKGEITFESKENQGTTFFVKIPVIKS